MGFARFIVASIRVFRNFDQGEIMNFDKGETRNLAAVPTVPLERNVYCSPCRVKQGEHYLIFTINPYRGNTCSNVPPCTRP